MTALVASVQTQADADMDLGTALLMIAVAVLLLVAVLAFLWWLHRNDPDNVVDLELERSVRSHPANTPNVTVLGWQGNVREFREGARR